MIGLHAHETTDHAMIQEGKPDLDPVGSADPLGLRDPVRLKVVRHQQLGETVADVRVAGGGAFMSTTSHFE